MQFAILFPLIAFGICLVVRNNGGWTWILPWPALSFFIVGLNEQRRPLPAGGGA